MQGLIVDALTSKRIPATRKTTSLHRVVAESATKTVASNHAQSAAVTNDAVVYTSYTLATPSYAVLPATSPLQSRIYDGTMKMSGNLSASSGQSGKWSGTLSDEIVMSVDRSGNGSGGETFSGNVTLTVTNPDGSQKSSTSPMSFFLPLFTLQHGKFTYTDSSTFDFTGLIGSLNVTGAFSGSQATISEHMTTPFTGFVNGVAVSGSLNGSGLLTTTPLIISGAVSKQRALGAVGMTPFRNLVITDLKNATVTATVTLSNPANGTLTNLAGGTYKRSKGLYTITGSETVVNRALNGLIFDPVGKQNKDVPNLYTGLALKVTDSAGSSLNNRTTSVVTSNPLYIMDVSPYQTTTGTKAITPFSRVMIDDVSGGTKSEFVKVTLSNAKNGTLKNLGGGFYNKKTGVYTIKASTTVVSRALQGLTFNPTTSSKSAVTTGFTISVRNAAGASTTNSRTTVVDKPAKPATTTGTGLALFSQYIAAGLHGVPNDAAAISALHDLPASSHIALASSH
jgi:hypothetical protein